MSTDRRRRPPTSSDRGAVAVLTAIFMVVLLVLTAVALDIGRWYVEVSRVQSAADAAALAGVTSMPTRFDTGSANALQVSSRNGYPVAGTTTVVPFRTARESEFGVTISSTVDNIFGGIFGNPTTTIVRSAVADFQDAALLGSPCNAFGKQPTSGSPYAQPANSVVPGSPPGYLTCQQTAGTGFWALIEGPNEVKINGDRYATIPCRPGSSSTSVYRCTSNSPANNRRASGGEYRDDNYYWTIKVDQSVVDRDVTVQLYDPAYVPTGQDCGSLPNSMDPGTYPYAVSDFGTRYDDQPNDFCTGDLTGGDVNTSFVLRNATETQNPQLAAPIENCTKQFRGYTSAPTSAQLRNSGSGANFNEGLAAVFHNWVTLCTFTPRAAGNYFLQVRTNVALAPTGRGAVQLTGPVSGQNLGIYNYPGVWTVANPNPVSQAAPTDESRDGINAFGIRAYVGTAGDNTGTANPLNTQLAVSGFERMPIWINVRNAEFNLIQVLPNAAGKSFTFSGFDFGDCNSCSGSSLVEVLMPTSTTSAGTISTCTASGVLNGALSTTGGICSFQIGSNFNGKLQDIVVGVPADYECATGTGGAVTNGDCWFRMRITYDANPNDVTTWDASINGDAVRLVR